MIPKASKFWLLIVAAIPLGMVAAQFRLLEPSSNDTQVSDIPLEWETDPSSDLNPTQSTAQIQSWNSNEPNSHSSSLPLITKPLRTNGDWSLESTPKSATPQSFHTAQVTYNAVDPNSAGHSTQQSQTPQHIIQSRFVPNGKTLTQDTVQQANSGRSIAPISTQVDSDFDANPVQRISSTDNFSSHQNYVRQTNPVVPAAAVLPIQDLTGPMLAAPAPPTVTGQAVTGPDGQTRIILPAMTDSNSSDNGLPVSNGKHPELKPSSTVQSNGKTITLRLNNEDLRSVLEMISMESGLSILPSESVKGFVTANISNVSVTDALEAILFNAGFQLQHRDGFVFVGTPADFDRMEQISLPAETRVVRPCFVSAQELQALIKPMLTANGTLNVTSAAPQGLQQSSGSTGGGSTLGGSSPTNNSTGANNLSSNYTGNDILVIRDVPTALLRVDELIKQIDVPPLQVAIEALILSVSLDDKHRLGVNLELLKGDGVRVVSGNLPGSIDTLETGQGLLSLGFLEANVGSFIAALDDIGETNVIAAPHVLALNKMSAQILIGEQIGFANTTVTQTAATQSIQFLDVGTQLQLRPHVNDEGLIRLEIHPEVSQGTVRSVGDLALPQKTVTQVTTNVMCRDNETIIIGGLIREEVDDVHRGVPLIGKMPVIGPLFRSRNRNTSREELIVLLTPHVVKDPSDAIPDNRVINNFVDRRASILINERKNWILRKQEAQRYVNLARNAWVSGNPTACQRYSAIALDLDPSCGETLSFASDILPADSTQPLPDEFQIADPQPIPTSNEAPPVIRYFDSSTEDSSSIAPPQLQETTPSKKNLGIPFGARQ